MEKIKIKKTLIDESYEYINFLKIKIKFYESLMSELPIPYRIFKRQRKEYFEKLNLYWDKIYDAYEKINDELEWIYNR